MKRKEITVIHITDTVLALGRAGQYAGQTNVAKLIGVTPPRAKRVLNSAVKLGLLYTYGNRYRSNVNRVCYSVTDTGRNVLDAIGRHDGTLLWSLIDGDNDE